MCGIVWVHRKDERSANKSVLKRFKNQRTRGVQGFGFVTVEKGEFKNWWQAQGEDGMEEGMAKYEADDILFHHRFPTSTPNILEATHPICVNHPSLKYMYFVVHNGVISNPDKLKEKYEKEGFVYKTKVKTIKSEVYETADRKYPVDEEVLEQYNDSESFAIDICKVIEDDKCFKTESEGSIAFLVLQLEKKTNKAVKMYFGRNARNPLKILEGKDMVTITSEGAGKEVDTNQLYSFDYKTGKVDKEKYLTVGAYYTPSTWNYGTGKKTEIGYKVPNEYEEYGIDSEYWPEYMKKKHGKKNKLLLTGKTAEEATDELEEAMNGKLSDYEVSSYADGSFVIWDLQGTQCEFESYDEFQDHYMDLVEKIAQLQHKLKEPNLLLDAEHSTSLLEELESEMNIYDSVYAEIVALSPAK